METTFSLSETSTLHRIAATSPPDHHPLTSDDAPSSWINLRTLKDAIRLSSSHNEHFLHGDHESSSSVAKLPRQRTGQGSCGGDGLRQYLMFKSAGSSQDTPGSLRESARQYLEGSSEGVIDKVTLEVKSPSAFEAEHVDTPTYRGQEEPQFQDISSQRDATHQFKRRKNKSSAETIEKPVLQSQPLNIQNHFRKQSQLIDLTNQIDSNEKFKRKDEGAQIRLQILDDGSSVRPPAFYKSQSGPDDDDIDKENFDPSAAAYPSQQRFKRKKSASFIDFTSKQLRLFHSQSSRAHHANPDFASKLLDNAMTDFEQRIKKLKFNSYVDLKAIDQEKVDKIELEDISPEKLTEEEPPKMNDYDQTSQHCEQSHQKEGEPAQYQEKPYFKRQNSMHRSIDSQGDPNGLRELRRENHQLKLELDRVRSAQSQEIQLLKAQLEATHAQEVQDREEEHSIIIDGMRTDYEERVETLRLQMVEQQQRHEAQMREQQMLFECRISEYRRQVEEMERDVEEVRRAHQVIEIPSLNLNKVSQSRQNRGPQQSHSLRSLQVQRNLFQFEDVEEDDRPLAQLQGLASYNSQNKLRSSLLPQILINPPKLDQAPHQPLKEVSSFNYSSNGQSSKPPLYHQSHQSNGLTYSKSKEQAMNFSFSDINRTESAKKQDQEILDKINQKQLLLIDAEKVCSHFIDHTLESPQADLQYFKKSQRNSPSKKQRTPTLRELLEPSLNASLMPMDDFMSPELQGKKGSQTTTNRKSRFFEALNHQDDLPLELDDGCENAPDESGFVSDDLEYPQQRIINESSLEQQQYEEDEEYQSEYRDKCDPEMYSPSKDVPRGGRYNQRQLFMMTGKSESAIEEDDEDAIPAISMSKAINSSCINFKRNNMLPQISQTMTARTGK